MGSVSVFVPCYKYGHYLRQCVESVLSQAGVDVRVLILDDASPDDTPGVSEELVRGDARVEYRRHAVNRGHIATYNEGIEWAGGDYTILLSADDLLAPGALARAVKVLDDHPQVGLAYGRGIVFRTDQLPTRSPTEVEFGCNIITGVKFLSLCCSEGGNLVCTPTAIVRTNLQHQLGGYRANLPHSGDMEMWMRFAAHSHVAFIDANQAYYRVHGANMSGLWFAKELADLKQRKAAFDALFREQADAISGHERLKLVADRTLSWVALSAAYEIFDRGDISSSREMLDLALEIYPGLSERPECGRLIWKQRIGFRFWSAIRPVIAYWRSRNAEISMGRPNRELRPDDLIPSE